MRVFKPKTRMLTIRLSEQDYQLIREASLASGARSVSDYARDSLFRTAAAGNSVLAVDELQDRMEQAESEIRSLQRVLQTLRFSDGRNPDLNCS
jgi:uncharacterized protein (DUF1778 family)